VIKTGLARFEFRHLPLHSQSDFAALAVECAADQGGFWPAHDRYMKAGDRSLYRRAGAVRMAEQLGLDSEQLGGCIDAREHAAAIEASLEDGIGRGFRRTPVVLVDGKQVDPSAAAVIAAVRAAAEQVATERPYRLIESIAVRMARRLLDTFPAEEVRVRVMKPGALTAYGVPWAGVEVVRSRRG